MGNSGNSNCVLHIAKVLPSKNEQIDNSTLDSNFYEHSGYNKNHGVIPYLQLLVQQKENLMEILEFFPDCLLILDKQQNEEGQIIFSNKMMQQFLPLTKQLVWDENLKVFVNRQAILEKMQNQSGDQEMSSQMIFETESDLVHKDHGDINEDQIDNHDSQNAIVSEREVEVQTNQQLLKLQLEQNQQTLWRFLIKNMFAFDRIKIQENDEHIEDSAEGNLKVFEFKQKEVFFNMTSSRLVILKDISELVKNEYNRSIQKLTEIMVASTSHDMRTPLNTIINMHQLIEMKTMEPQLKQYLSIAKNSTDLLKYLVNDTLDYFQIRSGKFKIQKTQVRLKDILEKCSDLISFPMKQKKLQQIVNLDEDIENEIFIFDEQRITQVLVNLLSNALKFTLKGFIKLSVQKIKKYPVKKLVRKHKNQITLNQLAGVQASNVSNNNGGVMGSRYCNQREHIEVINSSEYLSQIEEQYVQLMQLRFEVEDTGIGIKEDDMGRLFKMFGKIPNNDQLNPNGIGMGLTICNKILCQHGSELQVQSTYGKGTSFYFIIDMQQVVDQSQLEHQYLFPQESQLRLRYHNRGGAEKLQNQSKQQSEASMCINDEDSQFPLQTYEFNHHSSDLRVYSSKVNPSKFKAKSKAIEFDLLSSQNENNRHLKNQALQVPEFFQNNNTRYTNIYEMQRAVDMQFNDIEDDHTFNNLRDYTTNIDIQQFDEESKHEAVELADLSMSHKNKAITMNQIDIEFDNHLLKGSPQQRKSVKEKPSQELQISQNIINCSCKRVLVVDDNTFNVFTLQTILEVEFKLPCDIAYNGQQAVEEVQNKLNTQKCQICNRQYILIFMDIQMPVMNGYESSEIIRQLERDLLSQNEKLSFIVGLTAHTTEQYQQKCFVSGMNEFMTKPVDQKNLKVLLKKMNLLQ
eukprot:403366084